MLVGYMRVSSDSDRQTRALQRLKGENPGDLPIVKRERPESAQGPRQPDRSGTAAHHPQPP
jgi:hypothetical protein